MSDNKTVVIFRKWRTAPHTVIALFPEDPASMDGVHCNSYEHVGQHGAANPHLVIRITDPAMPGEYADLKAELESLGYSLIIRQRYTRFMEGVRYYVNAKAMGTIRAAK